MQMYVFQDSPWNHTYECYVVQYRSQWSNSQQDLSAWNWPNLRQLKRFLHQISTRPTLSMV
jgi:hypothetical protein